MSRLVHIPSKGPLSNLDVKLDPLELQRSMKLEEHMHVYDAYLDSGAAGDGTYGFQGIMKRNGELMVPKASMPGMISAAERVQRVKARMQSGKPLIMISLDIATMTPVFAEEDQEAFEAGFVCANCYQYQSVPNAPKCNWYNKPHDGCGHQNF